jgi:hypothetical protein
MQLSHEPHRKHRFPVRALVRVKNLLNIHVEDNQLAARSEYDIFSATDL